MHCHGPRFIAFPVFDARTPERKPVLYCFAVDSTTEFPLFSLWKKLERKCGSNIVLGYLSSLCHNRAPFPLFASREEITLVSPSLFPLARALSLSLPLPIFALSLSILLTFYGFQSHSRNNAQIVNQISHAYIALAIRVPKAQGKRCSAMGITLPNFGKLLNITSYRCL